MINSSTERGLSEVLGAILMFALVFAVLVIIQVWAVPTANAQIEIDHTVTLESEFGELSESFDRVTMEGAAETASLAAGVRYPSRIFLINPPPASYTFASSETYSRGLDVSNVVALDAQTQEYFDTLDDDSLAFDTRTYSLSTDYAQYAQPPVYHIEGGTVYKLFENDNFTLVDDGSIVNGRTITLVALEGEISTGGSGALSLPMAARTGPMQTTSIENVDGKNIVISLPTSLDTDDWKKILAPETGSNGHVVDGSIDVTDGILTFELAPGTYDLRLSKVRIGQGTVVQGAPAYITVPDEQTSRRVTGASDYTVQVRDEFNNPVSGVDVTFRADFGTFEKSGTVTEVVTSNENGMATARYDPADQNTVVKATIIGATTSEPDPKRVHFNVDYVGGRNTGDDGTNTPNPYTDNLVLVGTEGDGGVVNMAFVNKAVDDKEITDARVAFFYQASPGESGGDPPVSARLSYDGWTSDPIVIGRDLVSLRNEVVGPDETTYIEVQFFTDAQGTTPYGAPNADDFFVLTFLYEDTTTATYFVQGANGGVTLLEASASDVSVAGKEQTLSFKLGQSLSDGDEVTINLDSAQGNLDYSAASIDDNAGGDVAIATTTQKATLTYTADGSEKVGDVITITLSDIDTSKPNIDDTYGVKFTALGVQVIDTTFTVS